MFLHGDFSLISVASLIQMLCQERRSVRLRAWRGTVEARVDMAEGLILDASCASEQGEIAFLRLMAWDCGRFEAEPLDLGDHEASMAAPWEELMLEGARRRDELELTLDPLPPYPTRARLEAILRESPALAAVALVSRDGRLLGTIGMDEGLASQVMVLAATLDQAGRMFGASGGVAIFAAGGRRVLFTAHDDLFLLAVPAPGADLGMAAGQLIAQASGHLVTV